MDSDLDKNQPVVVERDGGVFYTYSNLVAIDWSAHDIRLRFSEISRLPNYSPDGLRRQRIEERASIALSWSQAKSLHDLLDRALRGYENLNGPINQTPQVPPSFP